MSDVPRVSIGVPVRNGERRLHSVLESIRSQTVRELEVIVCDNASTDRTEAIVRELAATDSRIRYHRNPENIGIARNFNRAIELARAPLFKWVADDHWCAPDFLAACIDALEAEPAAVLAYPLARGVDPDGRWLFDFHEQNLHTDSAWAHERFRYLLCCRHPCLQQFGVMRTEVLRRTGGQANCPHGDNVLLAELALHGPFARIEDRLWYRIEHGQGVNSARSLQAMAAHFVAPGEQHVRYPHFRLLYEHAAALRRAPVRGTERARCWFQMLRWLWQYGGRLAMDPILRVGAVVTRAHRQPARN